MHRARLQHVIEHHASPLLCPVRHGMLITRNKTMPQRMRRRSVCFGHLHQRKSMMHPHVMMRVNWFAQYPHIVSHLVTPLNSMCGPGRPKQQLQIVQTANSIDSSLRYHPVLIRSSQRNQFVPAQALRNRAGLLHAAAKPLSQRKTRCSHVDNEANPCLARRALLAARPCTSGV